MSPPKDPEKYKEWILLLSSMRKGKPRSREASIKAANSNRGKRRDPEAIANMRNSPNATKFKKGNVPWNTNKSFTPESRLKMSRSHIGIQSGENHPRFGTHLSDAQKEHLRVLNTGKTNHNREKWMVVFTEIIDHKHGGKCWFTKEEMSGWSGDDLKCQ